MDPLCTGFHTKGTLCFAINKSKDAQWALSKLSQPASIHLAL